jgi:hypothetical protein
MPSKKIGNYGKPWRIRRCRKPITMEGDKPGEYIVWGFCDFEKREVVLGPESKNHPVERETVLHEVAHKLMPFLEEDCILELAREQDDILDLLEL